MTNSDSGTKLNPGDRVRPSFAGDIQIAAVALETRWLAAEQAAEEAERQAKVARGEAEEARQEAKDARDELGAIRAERDALRAACQDAAGTLSLSTVDLAAKVRGMGSEEEALRGKLGAAEGDSATLHAALVAERKESAGWRSRALAAEAKVARETEEVARLEAALRTRKALGGVAVGLTLEQRVAEIEARLGRLETTAGAHRPTRHGRTRSALGATSQDRERGGL